VLNRRVSVNRSRIFPTLAEIECLKQPLEAGVKDVVPLLDKYLPSDWEIYVTPFLNGDQPDLAVFHPSRGITFGVMKDWDKENYRSEDIGKTVKGRKYPGILSLESGREVEVAKAFLKGLIDISCCSLVTPGLDIM